MKYEGHKNWNCWNVSLWMNNEYNRYKETCHAVKACMTLDDAATFLLKSFPSKTPDGAPITFASVRAALTHWPRKDSSLLSLPLARRCGLLAGSVRGPTWRKATLLRNIYSNKKTRLGLYLLSEPVKFGRSDEEHNSHYVLVSAVHVPGEGPGTYIFPADKHGDIISWGELPGSYNGGLSHMKALRLAGYELYKETE